MKIRVTFDHPPIPVRDMDYSAIDDDTYDGAPDAGYQPHGHGRTEDEAVRDLLDSFEIANSYDSYTPEVLAKELQKAEQRGDAITVGFIQQWLARLEESHAEV